MKSAARFQRSHLDSRHAAEPGVSADRRPGAGNLEGKVDAEPETDKATSKLFKPNATDAESSEGMKYMVGDPANSEVAGCQTLAPHKS